MAAGFSAPASRTMHRTGSQWETIFEIGSATKTFTALLLLDMVERGEMKLDDPVAMYLPKSVKVPSHGGREITLLNLAAQDSGLPFNADNLTARTGASGMTVIPRGHVCFSFRLQPDE